MPGGRPTKYNNSILADANDYLENFKDEGDVIPSVEGLSLKLNIARQTLYNWADDEDKKEFLDILENINTKQKKLLLNNGLTGEFNSNIAKLVLGKHGYSEKQSISATVTEISHEEWLDSLDG